MVISDRIAVMASGNVVQIGTPREIYREPADRFVADFIGTMNFMPGEVVGSSKDGAIIHLHTDFSEKMRCRAPTGMKTAKGDKVFASIRPEDVEVFAEKPPDRENLLVGKLVNRAYLGNFLYFFVDIDGTMIRIQVLHHLPHVEGQSLYVYLDPGKTLILK
jgi:iron(III) transport system ATP-binding protein